jgi:hypothetical protein
MANVIIVILSRDRRKILAQQFSPYARAE